MNNVICLDNINKSFNTINGEIEVLKNISFQIKEGEFITIVGNSGCGKSTLLSVIAKLIPYSSGKLTYNLDNPIIGYMLQEDALFDHLTIKENILLGLKILKKNSKEYIDDAMELLKKYNLEQFKDKYPRELSGGMRQRVALIRTLAIKPDILFLDEPFSALDFTTRLKVADDVYKIIKSYGKTTIMVTHDIGEAISMANRVIVLSKRPSSIKNIYEIELNKKDIPTINRKDDRFYYYYDKIWEDLDTIVEWSKELYKKILFQKNINNSHTIYYSNILFVYLGNT